MYAAINCLCFAFFGIIATSALPYGGYTPVRRPYPHQAMMFSGYYGRPSYVPEGAMTAYASRDTVATNTYMGENYPTYMEIPSDENVEENVQVQNRPQARPELTENSYGEAVEEENEPITTIKPKVNKRKQKPTKPVQKEQEDDEEENDEGAWPFQSGSGRRGVPAYNAFFPIMFGGARTRSGGENDGGYPGSATAIANSFSTGKGGVASSHATAYGDPSLSMLLRNGARNGGSVPKSKNN